MANAIVVLCTGLMIGAIVWVLVLEHKGEDYDEENTAVKAEEKGKEE